MADNFGIVFKRELEAVNFRRKAIRSGKVAAARKRAAAARRSRDPEPGNGKSPYLVDRGIAKVEEQPLAGGQETCRTAEGSDLTGISLSGGGVRSASFGLGVLQGLDLLTKPGEPQVLDALDYISTVSGGGYIGTSLVAGLAQPDHSFPFDSRLDEQETPEVKHLRDFSNFLIPNGTIDLIVGFALVLRGLLVNAVLALPFLLVLAVVTLVSNPTIESLTQPDVFGFAVPPWLLRLPGLAPYTLTINLAVLALVLMFLSALVASVAYRTGTLRSREILGRLVAGLLLAVVFVAVFETQPFVLSSMLEGPPPGNGDLQLPGEALGFFDFFAGVVPVLAASLAPLAVLLVSVAQKLANVAKAAIGEETWTAALAKYASRGSLFLAAAIVPLLLWTTYMYLCYWALHGCGAEQTPGWLKYVTACESGWSVGFDMGFGPILSTYLIVAVALFLICLLIGPNANSLHRLYRDRLSRAFLFQRNGPRRRNAPTDADRRTFSALKPFDDTTKKFEPAAAYSPYLLVNTTINLTGSEELNKRGRNADTFIFSPLYIGSRPTGYAETADMERLVPDVTLATAMAISGAAASANMGRATIRVLVFSLAMLNVRLGYWLANPGRLKDFVRPLARIVSNIGLPFFAIEAAGRTDERGLNVYLTDGGHVENLGIYELLRRRCKVIVAVDADMDPAMTFPSLISLEVMARIDLGVRIELPLPPLQASALGVTADALRGPGDPLGSCGPHAAIGIIRYSEAETGVLIHIKTTLSGDENDYVLDYKRRHDSFPHETTVDQFFSEEQFEAYRALGFHAARRLFTGVDDFAKPAKPPIPAWRAEVAKALMLLNIPTAMAGKILARIEDDVPGVTEEPVILPVLPDEDPDPVREPV